MKDQLKQLLEPAETSRADTFRWTDTRPVRQQVVSGIRRAGALIGGFGILVVSTGGLAVISDQQSHTIGAGVAAWLGLIVAATVMVWTANRWAPFVTGFFFGPAIVKIASVLMVGSDSYYSSHAISRTGVVSFLLYAIAVVALTLRFFTGRPSRTTVLDRFALTFFAFATLRQLVIPYQFPPWSLLLGGCGLLIAWYANFRSRRSRRHTPHRPSQPHA